jgi:hypothetical protein
VEIFVVAMCLLTGVTMSLAGLGLLRLSANDAYQRSRRWLFLSIGVVSLALAVVIAVGFHQPDARWPHVVLGVVTAFVLGLGVRSRWRLWRAGLPVPMSLWRAVQLPVQAFIYSALFAGALDQLGVRVSFRSAWYLALLACGVVVEALMAGIYQEALVQRRT